MHGFLEKNLNDFGIRNLGMLKFLFAYGIFEALIIQNIV